MPRHTENSNHIACPSCGCKRNKCTDSRGTNNDGGIRRRKQCDECGYRFTTYETVVDLTNNTRAMAAMLNSKERHDKIERLSKIALLTERIIELTKEPTND